MNVEQVAKKIQMLYLTLRNDGNSVDELSHEINEILLIGKKIPLYVLNKAWDLFAEKHGVERSEGVVGG